MRTPFSGVGTALITPFKKDGSVDEAAVKRLARRQIDAGVHFLSPCGTTGEAPTLTHKEKVRVVELVVEETNGAVPVLAGAGGYATRETIDLARDIAKAGADGLLSVTPYYNKPTPEGLYQHFKAIAQSTLAADRALQRAVADVDQHGCPHHGAALRDIEHRRHQGAGRPGPDVRARLGGPRGLSRAERGRSRGRGGHGGRRGRRRLGGLERGARRDGADRGDVREGRLRRRAQAAPLAAAAHPGELRRVQPHPVQGGDGGDGPHRRGVPAAARVPRAPRRAKK